MQVRVTVPEGSNIAELSDFMRKALSSYGGGLDPESPYFESANMDFTVKLVKKETTYG